MTPSISLVIPVYNRACYLPVTLDSILTQTHRDFELLIWDDGSTDNSIAIAIQYAQQDKRIRVVAATHQKQAPSLKRAIAQTTAPYVGWVDSDDLLAPTALEDTVTILNTNSQIGLVYTDYEVIDEHGNNRGKGTRCKIPYSKDRLLVDFMLFHFRLMRRSVYDQVGGIDASFDCAQDYDLCLKLSEVTEVYHLQKPLYLYRTHTQSISQQRRYEQIMWSKQAIENALTRRGLINDYELDVQISAQYTIRPRKKLHY